MEMSGDGGQASAGDVGAPLATTTRLPPLYHGPGGTDTHSPTTVQSSVLNVMSVYTCIYVCIL